MQGVENRVGRGIAQRLGDIAPSVDLDYFVPGATQCVCAFPARDQRNFPLGRPRPN
jgi:hypothetical protein